MLLHVCLYRIHRLCRFSLNNNLICIIRASHFTMLKIGTMSNVMLGIEGYCIDVISGILFSSLVNA